MFEYRTKYGFYSTYTHTAFLWLNNEDEEEPCLYFSDTIGAESEVEVSNTFNEVISVRLGMLYLMDKCTSSPDVWQMSERTKELHTQWIRKADHVVRAVMGTATEPEQMLELMRDITIGDIEDFDSSMTEDTPIRGCGAGMSSTPRSVRFSEYGHTDANT